MKKKKAIKIATASVLTASSIAAVAPFSTQAAVNVASTVTKATDQMHKAQSSYYDAVKQNKAVSAAAVQKEIDLAKKYYDDAVKVVNQSAGKQKSYYLGKLSAAMPYYNNAVAYVKGKKIAEGLNTQAAQLDKAVKAGDIKTVKSIYPSFNASMQKAETNIRAAVNGKAAEDVVIATLTYPKTVAAQASAFFNDKSAPVIKYTGSTTVNVANGASYKVPVLSATDNYDKTVKVTSVIKDAYGKVLTSINTKVPGTYTVTYSATDAAGNVAKSVVLKVVVAKALVKAINVSVVNPLSVAPDQNTVLVNQTALIQAKVLDSNGNPVSNATVVFAPTDSNGFWGWWNGQTIVKTDEDGVATTTVQGLGNSATDREAVSAIKYSASVVGTNVTTSSVVNFAAIGVNQVHVTNNDSQTDQYGNLVGPATNGTVQPLEHTTDMNGNGVDYVAGQQVSATGTQTHAVKFDATPSLFLPADFGAAAVSDYNLPINDQSGSYNPYTGWSKSYEVPAGLKYATVNFDSIQIDKNAEVTISVKNVDGTNVQTIKTINGNFDQQNFGVQVPIQDNTGKIITVSLKAPGQVETDLNGGVSINSITGVYENQTAGQAKTVSLPGSTISWSKTDVKYNDAQALPNPNKYLSANDFNAEYTYSYKLPVFPNTGDALIIGKDANGNVKQYLTYPTVNNGDNVNVLKAPGAELATLVTSTEATSSVGTLTQDGTGVVVNSEAVGYTNLTGTISVPGLGSDVLNATNNKVHTSVQWAPLPNNAAPAPVAAVQNAFALAGQNITVKAQLVDVNGNPVAQSGQVINWKSGNDVLPVAGNTIGNTGVTVVSEDTTTDTNGQATLVLSAPTTAQLPALTASNGQFKVNIVTGSNTSATATYNWVTAGLQYDPTLAPGDEIKAVGDTAKALASQPTVGTPNRYGFTVIAEAKANTVNGSINVSGLPVQFTTAPGSVGSLTPLAGFTGENGKALFDATSTVAGVEQVTAAIGKVTDTSKVVFNLVDANGITTTFNDVGTGVPALYSVSTLPISWQAAGQQESFIVPSGTTLAAGATSELYVKVTDKYGNALAGQPVTFAKTGSGSFATAAGVTTDANGIAKVTLDGTAAASGTQSIVTANVGGQTLSQTINWVKPQGPEFDLVNAGVNTTSSNDVVALTFSQPVNPDSIKASEFSLTGGGANYAIKEAKVVGNQVLLTLADSNAHLPQTTSVDYKVSVSAGTANGITYKAVDDFGRTLNAESVSFTLPSASQVSATYNAGVLNVKATDSNKPATGKVRVVASDAAAKLTVGNSSSQNGVLEFTATGSDDIAVDAPSGTSLTVYYNGVESTVYVK